MMREESLTASKGFYSGPFPSLPSQILHISGVSDPEVEWSSVV